MDSPVVGALLAFFVGAAVSLLNYHINLLVLKKRPSAIANISILRQLLSIGCLVGVYFLSMVLPWDSVPLLLGAAIGLTVPAILLSLRLAKINDRLSANKDDSSVKGEDTDE